MTLVVKVWYICLCHNVCYAILQVINKQALASAARQIWLVVHPDKVHGRDAQMASQEFGKLLGTLKEKGSL